MLAGGITVPAYTTYTERDYEYLIDDCKPSVIIVSDKIQYNKVKNIITNILGIALFIYNVYMYYYNEETLISFLSILAKRMMTRMKSLQVIKNMVPMVAEAIWSMKNKMKSIENWRSSASKSRYPTYRRLTLTW